MNVKSDKSGFTTLYSLSSAQLLAFPLRDQYGFTFIYNIIS